MGVEGRIVRDFFRNGWFTPTLQTRRGGARAVRVPGRREVIVSAAAIPSEEEALFLVGALERWRACTRTSGRSTRLVVDDGVVPLATARVRRAADPDDYLSWTEETESVFAVYRGRSACGWVGGLSPPRARQELTSRGWTVHENLEPAADRRGDPDGLAGRAAC